MKWFLSIVGRLLYRLMGWTFDPLPAYVGRKHVIIAFPHTTNMDTVRAFVGFRIIKRTGHIMIKNEWFFWPMSVLLRILGGIPVNRSAATGVVGQMVEQFQARDEFLLAIVPEGSRRGVSTIRTGFWHIAEEADVSIVCWFLDNQHRRTRWLGEVVPGGSKKDDILEIRRRYAEAGYTFPLDVDRL